VIQISSEPGKITEELVLSLENCNIFQGMPYFNCYQGVIDCRKATIMFQKAGYLLQYQRGIQVQLSAAAIPENTPNFFEEFLEVFLLQIPTFLPLAL
jgi:hypothetical protein